MANPPINSVLERLKLRQQGLMHLGKLAAAQKEKEAVEAYQDEVSDYSIKNAQVPIHIEKENVGDGSSEGIAHDLKDIPPFLRDDMKPSNEVESHHNEENGGKENVDDIFSAMGCDENNASFDTKSELDLMQDALNKNANDIVEKDDYSQTVDKDETENVNQQTSAVSDNNAASFDDDFSIMDMPSRDGSSEDAYAHNNTIDLQPHEIKDGHISEQKIDIESPAAEQNDDNDESDQYHLGTVSTFYKGDDLEVTIPFFDTKTKDLVKSMKGRWDPVRKTWVICPLYSKISSQEALRRIKHNLYQDAPEVWIKMLSALSTLTSTTTYYTISIGIGGAKIAVPPGHRHEWVLKTIEGIERESKGHCYFIPATLCHTPEVRKILLENIEDDKNQLSESLDYMSGFILTGPTVRQDIPPVGDIMFALPAFVREVDPNIEKEPLHLYPLRLIGHEKDVIKVEFITGNEAHSILRKYLIDENSYNKALDIRDINGRWSRRRK